VSPRRDQLERVIDGTKSVVPLATRRDLTFARQELVDGDIERVRAGMELLIWTYDQAEWQRHVKASADRVDIANEDLVQTILSRKRRTEWVAEQLEEMALPTVVITSTGILFGQIARLWRGSRRLADAHIEDRGPRYIVLTFAKRWWLFTWALRELWVPVPEPLEKDADELAATLNSWLERGARTPLAPRPG